MSRHEAGEPQFATDGVEVEGVVEVLQGTFPAAFLGLGETIFFKFKPIAVMQLFEAVRHVGQFHGCLLRNMLEVLFQAPLPVAGE